MLQHGFGSFHDITKTSDAKHGVNFRQLFLNGILISLCQAAGNYYSTQRAVFLVSGCLKDGINGFAFCGVNKAAGINDCEIGSFRIRYQPKTCLRHQIEHLFTVDKVFRAAERNQRKCMFHG